MLRTSALPTLALLLLVPGGARAQSGYATAPFRDAPVELAQAAAMERLEVAARALAAMPEGGVEADDDDDDDEAEAGGEDDDEDEGPLADFALFRGSLAAASPDLAQSLAEAIDEMAEAGERGGDASGPAGEVIELTGQARAALVTSGAADAPGFQAGLMASLLLDEGGVAEGYEEASEGEAGAYRIGWFALKRVKALWDGLAGQATPEQAADVGAMLAMLDELFPGGTPPEKLSSDPEQAEAPAQQLVGLLETVVDADLYPGRDLAGAMTLVHDLAAQGCTSLETGRDGIGVDELNIAASYYGQTVRDTLGVLAPDAGEAIADLLGSLDDGEADEAEEACEPLLEAFATGRAVLLP